MLEERKLRKVKFLSAASVLFLMLACSWFQVEPTPIPSTATTAPSPTPTILPTPGLQLQASTLTISTGEQITITITVINVMDATCNNLYYKDGSLLTYTWLGESESQLLELVSAIKPSGNFTFTLEGNSPGTAEIKAACSGNVQFQHGKNTILDQWYGVSEPIFITIR